MKDPNLLLPGRSQVSSMCFPGHCRKPLFRTAHVASVTVPAFMATASVGALSLLTRDTLVKAQIIFSPANQEEAAKTLSSSPGTGNNHISAASASTGVPSQLATTTLGVIRDFCERRKSARPLCHHRLARGRLRIRTHPPSQISRLKDWRSARLVLAP